MKNVNKQLNLLINFIENPYKIKKLIKMNMNLYVKFLLNIWKKGKVNHFLNMKRKYLQ